MNAKCLLLLAVLAIHSRAQGQSYPIIDDPCGYPDTTNIDYLTASMMNWGYGYDSLKADLGRWSWSPYVQIDSVGASVQNRALYMLTIANGAASPAKRRVWIHARTHPNEVQGTWVTNEVIRILLGESPLARLLRDSCIFNIMPMYNPDGVELRLPRQNANGVDIESNWAAVPGEPEVQVLRRVFTQLMSSSHPVTVALNMHSALACRRYFVYHAESGTSALFAGLQQQYIGYTRSHFPGGIEPYNYFVSWNGSAPTYYPESWFWYNHREATLALTYEDKNCASAGGFDSTAYALVRGIADYLNISASLTSITEEEAVPAGSRLLQNYPNPFNPSTKIAFSVAGTGEARLDVYTILGEHLQTLFDGVAERGKTYTTPFNAAGISSGVYLYILSTPREKVVRKMIIAR